MARRTLDAFDLDRFDAIITNAAGCGTHLKNYGHLLHDDPLYAKRAAQWSAKLRDIHEWLAEIGIRAPAAPVPQTVTYHEACHLCHGQKITRQPRQVLAAIPGLKLVELPESTWCCGSAGIYNLIQPEMANQLLDRKLKHIRSTGVNLAKPHLDIGLYVRETEPALRFWQDEDLRLDVCDFHWNSLALRKKRAAVSAFFRPGEGRNPLLP